MLKKSKKVLKNVYLNSLKKIQNQFKNRKGGETIS